MYPRLVAFACLLTVLALGLCAFFVIPVAGALNVAYFVPAAVGLVTLAVILIRRRS